MIKASELKIGNFLLYKDELIQLTGINTDKFEGINTIGETLTSNNIWLNPIPLTEEILLKCGFKFWGHKNQCASLQINDLVELEIDFDENSFCVVYNDMKIDGEHSSMQLNIQYLHQLQNLYFTLTGEELEVNL